ncbi:hypothetical protein P872_10330 [Rhodonellum psychrophilum GCM71 = DSM 17998]|uniref:Uncharacterized protein n=1 Tax=Rhodonellum psychrophilum GCM71 = DSM 17998 TaxID=1123057 RepID=U5BY00_9BACT|nr:hypothetical protein P872_10330 [Rhodonellum psychrophilum GCM71 = DSM 17998]
MDKGVLIKMSVEVGEVSKVIPKCSNSRKRDGLNHVTHEQF